MASWCAPRDDADQHRYPRYFVTIGEKSVEKRFELFVKPQTGAYLCLASVPVEHNECVVTCPDHTYPCEGIEDEDSFVRIKVPFRVTVLPDKFATKEDLLMRSRTDDEGLQAFPVPLGRDETDELHGEGLNPSEFVDGEMVDGELSDGYEDEEQGSEEETPDQDDYDPIADELIGLDHSDGEDHDQHRHLFHSDDDSSGSEYSGSDDDSDHHHGGGHDHFEPTHYRYFFGAEQQGGTVAMVKFGHTVDHDHEELALRFHSFRILVPWGEQAEHIFQHEDVHALAEQNRIMHITMEAAERLEDEPELLADELTELIGANPIKKKSSSPLKKVKKVASVFSRKNKSKGKTSIFKNPASTSVRRKKPSITSRLKSKIPGRKKKTPKSQGQKMALAKGRPSNFSRAKQSVKARVNKVRGKKPAGSSSSSSSSAGAAAKKPGRLSQLKQNVRQRVDTIRGKKPANKSAPPAKAATGAGGPKRDVGRAATSPGSVRVVTRDRQKANLVEEQKPRGKAEKEKRPKKPKAKAKADGAKGGAAGGGGGAGGQQPAGGASGGAAGGGGGDGGGGKPSAPVATEEKQVAPAGVYKRSAGPPPRQFGYTGSRQPAPAAQQSAPAYGAAASPAQQAAAPARTQTKPTSAIPATPPQKAAAAASSAAAPPAAKAPPRRFGDPRPPGQASTQKPAAQEAAKPLPRRHGSDSNKPVAQQKNPATGSSFKRSAKAGEKKPYWAQGAPGQPKPGEYGYGDTSGPALGTAKSAFAGGPGPVAPKPPPSSIPAAPQAASAPSSSATSSSGGGFSQQQQQQPTKIKIVNKTGGEPSQESRGGKQTKSSSSKASSSDASGDGKPSFSDRLKSKLPSKPSGDSSGGGGGASGGDSGGGGGGSAGGFGGGSGAMLPLSQAQDSSAQSGYAAQFQQQQQNAGFAGSGPAAQTGRMQGFNNVAGGGNPLANPPPGALAAPLAPGMLPPGTIMTTNGLMQLGPNGQFVPASQAQLAQMASAQGIQLAPPQQQQQAMTGQMGNPNAPAAVPAQPGSSRPGAVDFGPNATRVADDDESLAAVGSVGPPRAGGRSSVATPANVGDNLTTDERLTRQERAFKTIVVMHENNFGKKPSAAQKERLRLRIASISPPFTMVKVISQYMEWLIVDTGLRYQ